MRGYRIILSAGMRVEESSSTQAAVLSRGMRTSPWEAQGQLSCASSLAVQRLTITSQPGGWQ